MTEVPPPGIPDGCSVAFKEWEGICDALQHGDQALILRKGGIEEGPGGFAPDHPAFWLFPTRVHQAQQGLKPAFRPAETRPPEGEDSVSLRALVVVHLVGLIDRVELLPALDGEHAWTPETVEKRFYYKRPGLWVLGVRVYRRAEPFVLPVTHEYAGCKTWVPLGVPLPTDCLTPVLDDGTFRDRMARLRAVLDGSAPDHSAPPAELWMADDE